MQSLVTGVPRTYVETSVWGMALPGQPKALRQPTREFLTLCRLSRFAAYLSSVVLEEIAEADPNIRDKLVAAINRVEPGELTVTPESDRLADEYIKAGILPAKKRDDARHVAVATLSDMEFLVS